MVGHRAKTTHAVQRLSSGLFQFEGLALSLRDQAEDIGWLHVGTPGCITAPSLGPRTEECLEDCGGGQLPAPRIVYQCSSVSWMIRESLITFSWMFGGHGS